MSSNVTQRVKRKLAAASHKIAPHLKEYAMEIKVSEAAPKPSKGTVIFAGISSRKFSQTGKLSESEYLTSLCNVLRKNGFNTKFVTSVQALSKAIDRVEIAFVVLIYCEDRCPLNNPKLDKILAKAHLVFNAPNVGDIIADKTATHRYLSGYGVKMPKMQLGAQSTKETFSNHNSASGADVSVLPLNARLDPERYNTDFIDTRVTVGNETYYTTIRLMCIGGKITHSFVRARNIKQANPSVHTKDTPIDAGLLNTLFDNIVEPNQDRLDLLADALFQALGPGFYAHDVLIDKNTNKIYLAETGFKFDDFTFCNWLAPILSQIPSMSGFVTPRETAANSCTAFMDIINPYAD